MAAHVDYPHLPGTLYDCPPCEEMMAEECVSTLDDRCPACGELPDYCQGHGEIGDPDGARTLAAHDRGDHSVCVQLDDRLSW